MNSTTPAAAGRARDVVGALAQRGNRIGDRHGALDRSQERVIVLGVTDADHVAGRHSKSASGRRPAPCPRCRRPAAAQAALVEDGRAVDAGLLDGASA